MVARFRVRARHKRDGRITGPDTVKAMVVPMSAHSLSLARFMEQNARAERATGKDGPGWGSGTRRSTAGAELRMTAR
jgi:hypothetical protein